MTSSEARMSADVPRRRDVFDALCDRRRLGRAGYLLALLAERAPDQAETWPRPARASLVAPLRVRATPRRS